MEIIKQVTFDISYIKVDTTFLSKKFLAQSAPSPSFLNSHKNSWWNSGIGSNNPQNFIILKQFFFGKILCISAIWRIELCVSVCYLIFNITIFLISFSNAKCIWISLERLMIELYLYIEIYLDFFPGRLKDAELGKSTRLTFWVPVQNAVEVIP